MHDVLDVRDLVPDEAEQLLHSGYPVAALLARAREAAASDDFAELQAIDGELSAAERSSDWSYDEPDEDGALAARIATAPEFPVDRASLPTRIHGAWLGRCVANTMGKPVEGLTPREVRIYLEAAGEWPQTGYIPLLAELPEGVSHLHESSPFASAGRFDDVPRDDDLDWTVLGLHMIEQHGAALSTDDIARTWLDLLPFTQTFTAERAVYRNLIRGHRADEAALVGNPYREWIGALIRADIFGFVEPGRPAHAARRALIDARLSHVANGVYGELWAAALVSSALAVDDAETALRAALTVIPPRSRLAEALVAVLNLHEQRATSDEAHAWVIEHLGHYNWVHTVNNAALISIGLLWGTDFTTSVALTIAGGCDTDSSAATVGSVYGALHGADAIPSRLIGTTHHRIRSAVKGFDRVEIRELAERTLALIGDPE